MTFSLWSLNSIGFNQLSSFFQETSSVKLGHIQIYMYVHTNSWNYILTIISNLLCSVLCAGLYCHRTGLHLCKTWLTVKELIADWKSALCCHLVPFRPYAICSNHCKYIIFFKSDLLINPLSMLNLFYYVNIVAAFHGMHVSPAIHS